MSGGLRLNRERFSQLSEVQLCECSQFFRNIKRDKDVVWE